MTQQSHVSCVTSRLHAQRSRSTSCKRSALEATWLHAARAARASANAARCATRPARASSQLIRTLVWRHPRKGAPAHPVPLVAPMLHHRRFLVIGFVKGHGAGDDGGFEVSTESQTHIRRGHAVCGQRVYNASKTDTAQAHVVLSDWRRLHVDIYCDRWVAST